jgi:5'-methylthioadenosine phosphorylase
MRQQALVGVIGGSGLYQMDALSHPQQHIVDTPFGSPSGPIVTGEVAGVPVAFIARHGQGHRLLPSEVPYRANVYALKKMGVRYILSVSAVGSLSESMAPMDMVLPDQFIDLTRLRANSFFGAGAVAHVSMAQPICAAVSQVLARSIQALATNTAIPQSPQLHQGGTYVCIEGPQFSSMAESHWYRSMGASIIGMTNMPEAKLAREAQVAYSTLAMVTDYDCWHPREAHVTAGSAIANLMKNAENAQHIIANAIAILGVEQPTSDAHTALLHGLVTQPDAMAPEVRSRLQVLLE